MKICPKCQCELEDIAKFCLRCGEKVNLPEIQESTPSIKKSGESKIKRFFISVGKAIRKFFLFLFSGIQKIGKNWKIILPILAVIAIVLIIILSSVAQNKSYKGVLKRYTSLLNHQEDDYMEYLSIFLPEDLCNFTTESYELLDKINDDYTDVIDDCLYDTLDDYFDMLEDDFGKSHIKIKVLDAKQLEERKLQSLQDDIQDYAQAIKDMNITEDNCENLLSFINGDTNYSDDLYKFTKRYYKLLNQADIQKGYDLKLQFSVNGKEGRDSDKVRHVRVYKVNDNWILDITSLEDFPDYANPFVTAPENAVKQMSCSLFKDLNWEAIDWSSLLKEF